METIIKKVINFFMFFFGLIVIVLYTLFFIQNRVLVPVRLTFDQPSLHLLPLIVFVSVVTGIILGSSFIIFYRLSKSYPKKVNVLPVEEKMNIARNNPVKLIEDSAIPNGIEGLDEIRSSNKVHQNPEKFSLRNNPQNINDDNFYIEYEKCKKEIDDLFKSAQNKLKCHH